MVQVWGGRTVLNYVLGLEETPPGVVEYSIQNDPYPFSVGCIQ